ncbi:Glycosyl transferase, family 39 [Candidatus Sulfotelmatobacter kueseliae]|uniref:Glycosyl transferase, family 39 n=1 Tax=Candidatus Sulfotelmatobacter kueseliae TaxID=2042962 RepID=A0A2U3KMW0_9BACT|nr:Glycosyl transferase, family 39 [Candidatus Sulfotelmatobacter kueseliae]
MDRSPALSAPDRDRQWLANGMAIVWAIALADLVFHIYFNNRYGYFRDEFDYMSCGEHLQWGYVDQPPLIPFLIHVCRAVLGDSLRAIRFVPAVASSLLLVQTAAIARELGGRRYALVLSAICALVSPQYLSNGSLLGTNCLEPNLWMGCAYFVILAIKRSDPRYWLWFGVTAGLGMENKYSIAVFGLGIVVGPLLTAQRRVFLNPWIWLGGVVAFLVFLPNLLWNIHYDWPFLQLMHNIRAEGRDLVLGPFQFFFQQVLVSNPLNAPLWLAGLFALLFSARLRPYCALGWAYLVSYAAFFVLHGKNYYLAPIYPMLFAAGAVVLESGLDRRDAGQPRLQWLKPVIAVVLLANGAYLAPIVIPILSPEHFLAYAKTLPFKLPVNEYSHARAALPQWYSDQFGYKEIADEALVAWDRIPAAERSDCGIFGQDYGQAGAIDFFDRKLGLPPAFSGDRTYWIWGPRGYSGNCLIVAGDRRERLEQLFGEVDYVGTSADNPWALESNIGFYICRKPKFGKLAELWPQIKRWR